MTGQPDAIVIGSGPNGLSAAIALAQAGVSVRVVEADEQIGGGTRSRELTLPGFTHDVCSAVHPMGVLSPFWRTLPLDEHGLEWASPPASVAHPMPDGSAVMIWRSLERTAEALGRDGANFSHVLRFVASPFPCQLKSSVTDAHTHTHTQLSFIDID